MVAGELVEDGGGVTEPADGILAERCLDGRAESFRVLFERHRHAAYRLALALLGGRDDALDVVQEAFVRAYQKLGDFDRTASFRPWLLRIARNCAYDLLRRRRLEPKPLGPEEWTLLPVPEADGGPEHAAHAAELAEQLTRALGALSVEHREVFLLRELQQLSYDEIASVVAVPRGTVMSRLHYARRALRRQLEEWL